MSSARNAGLRIANGEYVWFIDSDDFISPNALSLVNDLLLADSNQYAVKIQRVSIPENIDSSSLNYSNLKLDYNKNESPTAFNIIVKREYLLKNNIRFKTEMSYGEDTLWVFWVTFFSQQEFRKLEEPVYFYRQRSNSALHDKSMAARNRHLESMIAMLETYQEALLKYGNQIEEIKRTNLKDRINWSVQNVLFDATRLPSQEANAIRVKLKSQGLIPAPINYNRISFNHGLKNLITTLIGIPLQFKVYFQLINFLMSKQNK